MSTPKPSDARVLGIDFGSTHITVAVRTQDGSIRMVDGLPTGIPHGCGLDFGTEMANAVHVSTVSTKEPEYQIGIRGMEGYNFESFKSKFDPCRGPHCDKLQQTIERFNAELQEFGHEPIDFSFLLKRVVNRVMRAVQAQFTPEEPLQAFVGVPNHWLLDGKDQLRRLFNAVAETNGIKLHFVLKTESEASAKWYFGAMGGHGTVITVCDLGGSSIDIVTYERTGDTTLSQSIPAEGSIWPTSPWPFKTVDLLIGLPTGGNDVDANFRKYVEKHHTSLSDGVDNCLNPGAATFANAKRSFTGREDNPIKVWLCGVQIEFPRAVMEEFYQPVVAAATRLISNQLREDGERQLMMVGGLARSPYVMDCIRNHVKVHHSSTEVLGLDEWLEPQLPEAVARGLVSEYTLERKNQILGHAVGIGFIEDAGIKNRERMVADNALWVFQKGSPLLFNSHTVWLNRELVGNFGETFPMSVKLYSTTTSDHMRPVRKGQFPDLRDAQMTRITGELLKKDIFEDGAACADVRKDLFETRNWVENRDVYYIQRAHLDEDTILRLEIYVWRSATRPSEELMRRNISSEELTDEALFACVSMGVDIAFRQYAATGNDQLQLKRQRSLDSPNVPRRPKRKKAIPCPLPARPVPLKNGENLLPDHMKWWQAERPSEIVEVESVVMMHRLARGFIELVFQRHKLFSDVFIERGIILDPSSNFDKSRERACQADVLRDKEDLSRKGSPRDVTIILITVGFERLLAVIVACKGRFFNVYCPKRVGKDVNRLEEWTREAKNSLESCGTDYGKFEFLNVTPARYLNQQVTAVVSSVIQAAKEVGEVDKGLDFGYNYTETKSFLTREILCVARTADQPVTETSELEGQQGMPVRSLLTGEGE